MNMLEVANLGKSYRRYASEGLRVASWLGLPASPVEEHWVLRHVTFRLAAGESLGIIGQNGAGKSTLLKIIAGVLAPSEGGMGVNGRISAILELGLGFSPEFTGRQNVYHAGGLLGYNNAQIDQMVPIVHEFSELGEFFDRPLRTYSTGMHMRLAFSVVTARQPDVLIVDEALAVGDAYFQHKSFARIREFRNAGTTVLFVSHDPASVLTLCDRTILLDQGTVVKDGDPQEVVDVYNALIADRENRTLRLERTSFGVNATISGTGEAKVQDIGLYNQQGKRVEVGIVGEPVELRIDVRLFAAIPRLVLGYMIKDRLGYRIYGTNTHHTKQALENVAAGSLITYRVRFNLNLSPGSYSVSTALVSTDTHLVNNYEWKDLALVFNVANLAEPYFLGCAWIPPRIDIERP